MSAKWEKQEGNQGVLTVEVEAAEFDKALDKAFTKVVKQVNVPGFRKGKMPRPLFEKRFGVESLYQDALDILLPEAYSNAIVEAGIEPVDRPEIDVETIEKGQPLVFTAKVTVKHEVKLGEYKNLEVELKTLQERHAEIVVKEEGTVAEGDTAVIDFEGFVDGEAFEGGKGENYSLEIGSNTFIPGFEEQLVGLEVGAEKEVEVTFPEEYHAEELAGKAAKFKVKLNKIKSKELPALDDEFAKDVDEEVETLEALKAKTKEKLQSDKENQAESALRDTLVEKAAENAEVEIPEAMFNTEMDRMMQEFEQRLQMQGLNLELYFQFSGQDEKALRDQMRPDAEKRVKINLTLEAISKAENLEVSEEEVEKELENMAGMYNMPVEEIKKVLGSLDSIKEDMKVRKAVEFLVENSKAVA